MQTQKNKRVLLIAYHLPPLGGIPVMRPLRLLRYLPNHNWQPVVITSKQAFDFVHSYDKALLKKIPPSIVLRRVWDPLGAFLKWLYSSSGKFRHQIDRFSKILFIPDEKIFWSILAFFEAIKTINKTSIDVIYATGYPWSSLLVGIWLKKKCNKPLVIDLRDPWTLSPMPAWSKNPLHHLFEKKILKEADKVIFTSNNTVKVYQVHYPDFSSKMLCIHNGFDPEDLEASDTKSTNAQIRLLYAGSLGDAVPPKTRTRSIIPLLKGIAAYEAQEKKKRRDIIFDIYSNEIPKTHELAKELHLTAQVNFLARIPHAQIIEKLQNSDIGVLIVQGSEDGQQIVPAKLYEYIATGLPVFAFAPEHSEVAEIIQKFNLGQVVTYNEKPYDIAQKLALLISNKNNNIKFEAARNAFNGENLVAKFVACIDELNVKNN